MSVAPASAANLKYDHFSVCGKAGLSDFDEEAGCVACSAAVTCKWLKTTWAWASTIQGHSGMSNGEASWRQPNGTEQSKQYQALQQT
ncbi:hypothetical protein CEXT_462971 [Caerostris extrusa]|uniref:Uncharacterized protein n=1 Tax=Caerostris extrusa TaxID=172846 RepID=A0AAV4XKH6_CAEEX|nr:hypothetical protein CEXT_462971 [Caerostris extrusa]